MQRQAHERHAGGRVSIAGVESGGNGVGADEAANTHRHVLIHRDFVDGPERELADVMESVTGDQFVLLCPLGAGKGGPRTSRIGRLDESRAASSPRGVFEP